MGNISKNTCAAAVDNSQMVRDKSTVAEKTGCRRRQGHRNSGIGGGDRMLTEAPLVAGTGNRSDLTSTMRGACGVACSHRLPKSRACAPSRGARGGRPFSAAPRAVNSAVNVLSVVSCCAAGGGAA